MRGLGAIGPAQMSVQRRSVYTCGGIGSRGWDLLELGFYLFFPIIWFRTLVLEFVEVALRKRNPRHYLKSDNFKL